MVLISSRNRSNLSFENHLKSRRNKERCELEMNDSAFDTIEIVTRVKYYYILNQMQLC
jgi:hypothetical protein